MAIIAALYTHAYHGWYPATIKDIDQVWVAAHALWDGQNAYRQIGPGRVLPFAYPFAYPMTTATAALPFVWFPMTTFRVLFAGVSVGLLVWAVRPRGWQVILPLIMSRPFMNSLWNVQWSMLMTAGMARPDVLSALAPLKPTVGMAILARSPTRRPIVVAIVTGVVLLAISLMLRPTWIPEWIGSLRESPAFPPPIMRWGGPLLLLAGLRWRDADARMLLALSVVPQTPVWYEALPLFLIPRNIWQAVVLLIGSHLAFNHPLAADTTFQQRAEATARLMQMSLYLPALGLVLLRDVRWPLRAWAMRIYRSHRTE